MRLQPTCASAAAASDTRQCVVVGGGVGGLALAGRLARAGLQTTVLEKNSQAGGRAASMSMDGFRFDTGPSLLLFPDKYREAFAAMGADTADYFEMRKVERAAYRVFFAGGGGSLDMLYDVDDMAVQLEGVEAGAGKAYVRWLAAAGAALRAGLDAFIDRPVDSLAQQLHLPTLLPLLGRVNLMDLLAGHHSRLGAYFRDERLRALFSFQDLYVGLSPFNAPAAFSLLAATELLDGVHYPLGGFGEVASGLEQAAARCGAAVHTGVSVTEVLTRGRRVVGVATSDGRTIPADVVVANRDLPAAYQLLHSEYGRQRGDVLYRKKYSAGVLEYCWTVPKPLPQLLHHNVFLSDEYERSWRRATSPAALAAAPNFYVHVPNRTDPSAAPPGCCSVMVLLPVANMQEMAEAGADPHDYAPLVAAGRAAVLATLRGAGVDIAAPDIGSERVTTPPEWGEAYGLAHGAAFGLAHGLDQLAALRPSNKDPEVEGLYFVGASTRPGNGVPLALISAKLTANRILSGQ